MCDLNLLGGMLVLAEVAVIAACVALLIAINQAGNIFTAFNSVGLSILTSILIAAALVSLGVAAAVASSSGCSTGTCSASMGPVLTAINLLIGVLTGVLAAILVATFIPGAAAFAGPAALVLLLGAAGSFAYLGTMLTALGTCFTLAVGGVSGWIIVAAGIAFVTAVVVAIIAIYGIIVTIAAASE